MEFYVEKCSDWEGRYNTTRKQWDDFLLELKKVGVDWNKTDLPKSEIHPTFEGTENDSGRAETLLGTIILNNGNQYMIGVGNQNSKFSDYIIGLSEMIDEFNSDPFSFNKVFK